MLQRRLPQRAEAPGFRKISVLVVLLVLIVVCMRQLSDPERIAPALEAIGLVPHALNDKNLDEVLAAADAELIQKNGTIQTQYLLSSVWLPLIQDLPSDRFRDLSILCFQDKPPMGTSIEAAASSVHQSVLAELYDAVDKRFAGQTLSSMHGPSDQALDRFKKLWFPFREVQPNDLPKGPLLESLRSALDRRLLDSFEDEKAWHGDESISLVRALQKETHLKALLVEKNEPSSALVLNAFNQQRPLVPLPLLTSKTASLRGRLIRVRGRVIQADPSIIVKRSALGEYSYREVWVRPEYNDNTLACLFFPAELGQSIELEANIDSVIEFTAIPIKRLAYVSQSGTNTATVLVATKSNPASETPSSTLPLELNEVTESISRVDLNLILHVD